MGLIRRHRRERRAGGQSLVEFALVLPVLMLIVLIGLDFGRAFIAYVGLQNAARIAANYASLHPDAWQGAGNATYLAEYQTMVAQDFRNAGCQGPTPVPAPAFVDGTYTLNSRVQVALTCRMPLVTPFIGDFFSGGKVTITGFAAFQVRGGIIATGGGGSSSAPQAAFTVSPTSGTAPLLVTLTNTTTGTATNWSWDFGDGQVSYLQNPGTHTYSVPPASGSVYTITLTATNASGSTSHSADVTVAAPTGLTADFSWTPTSPVPAETVTFTGVASGGTTPYTWTWAFGDGGAGTGTTATNVYLNSGPYTVTLTVKDQAGATVTKTHSIVIQSPCTVPALVGANTSQVQKLWNDAGFTTNVDFNPRQPPQYKVGWQSVASGVSGSCSRTQMQVAEVAP